MAGVKQVIKEWLSDYKALSDAEIHTYAATVRGQQRLINALRELLDDHRADEVHIGPVCHQLFDFYRSGITELKRFTLELVPTLVWSYLASISHGHKKRCGGVEATLLGIYNLETVDEHGKAKVKTFTIPTLASPSIFHEPPSLATMALTESTLMRYHSDHHTQITIGPVPQISTVTAQNRLAMLVYVMNRYNADIANLSTFSHKHLCKVCSRLTRTGFENIDLEDLTPADLNASFSSTSSRGSRRSVQFHQHPRITLSSRLLVEMLHGIYFIMFNGQAQLGIQALEDIHSRSSYELYADVLLMTNGIRNSLLYNPSGQPEDGPMGISIALSPTQSSPSFSKNAITNASFRTKKLPDDIPSPSPEDKPDNEVTGDQITESTYFGTKDKLKKDPKESKRNSKSDVKEGSDMKAHGHRSSGRETKRQTSQSDSVKSFSSVERGGEADTKRSSSRKEKRKEERLSGKRSDSGRRQRENKRHASTASEDIDVPDDTGQDNPPAYEDVAEPKPDTDKHKTVAKLTKPLKSIIKKNQQDKAKMTRRESDNKRREFLEGFHVAGSPKHSMSVSTALSSSYNGGEALDPSMVSVQVVRSNSKTRVDQIELLPPSGLILGAKSDHQHRRTNSFPDSASLLRNGDHVVSSNSKTSSINCSKETPLLGEEPRSSSESLNTAL